MADRRYDPHHTRASCFFINCSAKTLIFPRLNVLFTLRKRMPCCTRRRRATKRIPSAEREPWGATIGDANDRLERNGTNRRKSVFRCATTGFELCVAIDIDTMANMPSEIIVSSRPLADKCPIKESKGRRKRDERRERPDGEIRQPQRDSREKLAKIIYGKRYFYT